MFLLLISEDLISSLAQLQVQYFRTAVGFRIEIPYTEYCTVHLLLTLRVSTRYFVTGQTRFQAFFRSNLLFVVIGEFLLSAIIFILPEPYICRLSPVRQFHAAVSS